MGITYATLASPRISASEFAKTRVISEIKIAMTVIMKRAVDAFLLQNFSSTTRTVAKPPSAKILNMRIIEEHRASTPKSSGEALLAIISEAKNPIACDPPVLRRLHI